MIVNQSVKYNETGLSRIFTALADPTRRSIILRLTQQQATVGDLAKPFSMSLPAVSKHLRVLEKAGLIRQTKQGKSRICAINEQTLDTAAQWLSQQRLLWEANFTQLDEYLATLSKGERHE